MSQSVAHRYVSVSANSSGSNSHRYPGPSVSATVSRCYRYRYLAAIDFSGCSILCVVVVAAAFLLGCTHHAYCRELTSISGNYAHAYCYACLWLPHLLQPYELTCPSAEVPPGIIATHTGPNVSVQHTARSPLESSLSVMLLGPC